MWKTCDSYDAISVLGLPSPTWTTQWDKQLPLWKSFQFCSLIRGIKLTRRLRGNESCKICSSQKYDKLMLSKYALCKCFNSDETNNAKTLQFPEESNDSQVDTLGPERGPRLYVLHCGCHIWQYLPLCGHFQRMKRNNGGPGQVRCWHDQSQHEELLTTAKNLGNWSWACLQQFSRKYMLICFRLHRDRVFTNTRPFDLQVSSESVYSTLRKSAFTYWGEATDRNKFHHHEWASKSAQNSSFFSHVRINHSIYVLSSPTFFHRFYFFQAILLLFRHFCMRKSGHPKRRIFIYIYDISKTLFSRIVEFACILELYIWNIDFSKKELTEIEWEER